MKWITVLLCLFLWIPVEASADTETEVRRWEHRLPHITKKDASACSKEMASLYQSVMHSYLRTQSGVKKSDKECKKWEAVKENWYAKVKIRSQQFGYNQILDRNMDKALIQKWILQQGKIDSALSYWRGVKKEKSKKMAREKGWLNRLEDCQRYVFEKFHSYFQGFKKGGKRNTDRSIQGNVDLPVYGSMKSLIKTNQKACPTLTDGKIGEYSHGWIPMIENGTISAGTWAYPRRRNAPGDGYCGSVI